MTDKVSLEASLARFEGHWQPRVVGTYNGNDLMVVKVQGEFPRHSHPETDDLFLVLKGRLGIRLWEGDAERTVMLNEGELLVVPAGTDHAPFAEEEAHILLIEPRGTPNTGDPTTAEPRRLSS